MMPSQPLTIVGGGLAGLTLGIKLQRQNIPVVIWEAGQYPRHKVCGEFISGRGLAVLKDLGMDEKLRAVGAREAQSASFFSGANSVASRHLPESALCLSRFQLDALLAEEFIKSGGELRENSRWTKPLDEGVIRATGRLMKPVAGRWRWFGLKVHARNLNLVSDLEMHFLPHGYVGLCRLTPDTVNVCGLFRSETTVPNLAKNWRRWLSGNGCSRLEERFSQAIFEEDSFCSTAGLDVGAYSFDYTREFCLGDSIGVIPPVTGNGMSIAFESADLAAESLSQYHRKELNWAGTRKHFFQKSKSRFQKRLRSAAWLQRMLFCRTTRMFLFCTTARQPALWRYVFSITR